LLQISHCLTRNWTSLYAIP